MNRNTLFVIIVLFLTACRARQTPQPTPTKPATSTPAPTLIITRTHLPTPSASMPVETPSKTPAPTNIPVKPLVLPLTQTQNVELVGHIGGAIKTVFVQGNYAYVGESVSLVVLDITDPIHPVPVGRVPLPDVVVDIYVNDHCAYVAVGEVGLWVVDVSDPTLPVKVGLALESAVSVTVADGYAYLAGKSLRILDVTNPAAPVLVGAYNSPSDVVDVAVANNHAYVATQDDGLRVVDISDQTAPREIGSCDVESNARGIKVAGDYAYMADYYAGLRVIDVSDSTAPTEIASDRYGNYFSDVAVTEDYAYLVWGECGSQLCNNSLLVMDITDPTTPTLVGSFSRTEEADIVARAVAIARDPSSPEQIFAYVAANQGGLQIVDVSDRAAPTQVGSYRAASFAWDLALQDGYAYIAAGEEELQVVDVSDPTSPVRVGAFNSAETPLGFQGSIVAVADNDVTHSEPAYVYAAWNESSRSISNGGLRVIDVSDPAAPKETGFFEVNFDDLIDGFPPTRVWDVTLAGSYAFLKAGAGALQIVDVSNVTRPVKSGSYFFPMGAYQYYVSDKGLTNSHAYLVGASERLEILDVSDPTAPIELGHYDLPERATGLAVVENPAINLGATYAFVSWSIDTYGSCEGGLHILDVSDPAAPVPVGLYETPARNISVTTGPDQYVFLTKYSACDGDSVSGLWVLDVSNPSTPIMSGFYEMPAQPRRVLATDGHIYVAAGFGGLFILEFTPPAATPALVDH
jgi:hypothetical protein